LLPRGVRTEDDLAMAMVTVGDLHMHVDDLGVPEGQPLVMLHGFTGVGRREWQAQIDAFTDEFRVVVPDLRGHGGTDNPAGREAMNHRQFAADVAGLCDALQISRAIFVGESTGSMLQLSLLLQRPDLVVAAVLGAATYEWSAELRAQYATAEPDELARTWFPEASALADFRSGHTALGPDHWRTVIGDFIALFRHEPLDDFPDVSELSQIETPVLIIHGDRDHQFSPELACRLYRLLPDAELCILPSTGHWPQAEQPDAFNLLVAGFLKRRGLW
jgi:pimeloyl-ACP methyl ester carboxylesterase